LAKANAIADVIKNGLKPFLLNLFSQTLLIEQIYSQRLSTQFVIP